MDCSGLRLFFPTSCLFSHAVHGNNRDGDATPYCFTAVSVSVSVSVQSRPKAPLLNFFWGAPKYDPSYVEIIFHW